MCPLSRNPYILPFLALERKGQENLAPDKTQDIINTLHTTDQTFETTTLFIIPMSSKPIHFPSKVTLPKVSLFSQSVSLF